jgi:hypothetical protein
LQVTPNEIRLNKVFEREHHYHETAGESGAVTTPFRHAGRGSTALGCCM